MKMEHNTGFILQNQFLANNDSLMYNIEAENVYEDFYKDKESFGFSN